tara:strand:+ start:171 stop:944 length:774 start_codon:yes stop_codon:yes gene_type:complete
MKVHWKTNEFIVTLGKKLPIASNLPKGFNQATSIRENKPLIRQIKSFLWPLVKIKTNILTDGFLEDQIGKLILKYFNSRKHTFLEVGCGDMSIRDKLPKNIFYNAFDLSLSDFFLKRTIDDEYSNIAICSATEIPLEDNSVDFIVSMEVFEHIPEINKAISEISRIQRKDGYLCCTIPNNLCFKYDKAGKNIQHINEWGYEQFVNYMKTYNYELIEGKQMGRWLFHLGRNPIQLPFVSKDEYYNTNFIYCFKNNKKT